MLDALELVPGQASFSPDIRFTDQFSELSRTDQVIRPRGNQNIDMVYYNVLHDWMGGYPYEVIGPQDCCNCFCGLGFWLEREFVVVFLRKFRVCPKAYWIRIATITLSCVREWAKALARSS
ncbi:MAG: hypothetical protein AB7P21_28365 [Lautropia sp.]